MSVTSGFPLVNVPVLSEQMIVVEPSVSTAISLRIIAWWRAILCIPSASTTVTTAGKDSGIAATAAATQAGNSATGNIHESFSFRAKSTSANTGPTVSVDTTGDMLCVIEGSLIVTATGTLELYHASEVAASSTVKAGTLLIVTQVA
jgi:hypothetical protein